MKHIFVFGSNLAGRHGAGSALHAAKRYGAQRGIGEGRTGDAYAIPTMKDCAFGRLAKSGPASIALSNTRLTTTCSNLRS